MNRYEQLKADLKKENAGKHYLKHRDPTDCVEVLCSEIDKLRADLAAAQGDAFITKALLCSPVTGERLAIVDVSTGKKSYRITVGNGSEKWIHTIGTEEAPATNAQLAAQQSVPPEARAVEAAEIVDKIVKLCDHNIPHHAYGDNEAACDMANRVDDIHQKAMELEAIIQRTCFPHAEGEASDLDLIRGALCRLVVLREMFVPPMTNEYAGTMAMIAQLKNRIAAPARPTAAGTTDVETALKRHPSRPLADGEGASPKECDYWDIGFRAGFDAARSAKQAPAAHGQSEDAKRNDEETPHFGACCAKPPAEGKKYNLVLDDGEMPPHVHSYRSIQEHLCGALEMLEDGERITLEIKRQDMTQAELDALPEQ